MDLTELLTTLVDFVLHFDQHLERTIEAYGVWTYAVLFAIVFCETGLVVTPFLPGDSLLFAAGAFAATGQLSVVPLVVGLIAAAVLGDTVNYTFGRRFGEAVLARERLWLIRRQHIQQTERFFERHGGKAVVYSRFVPIVRTFAPFIAGAGQMNVFRFMAFNACGGTAWVTTCTAAGYLFGHLPVIRDNFSLVAMGIVAVSVIPMGFELLRSWAANTGRWPLQKGPTS
jgi:membrane-associated protein